MSSSQSSESWLGTIVDYVSPASWFNWFFASPSERLDLENIPTEHDLSAGSTLIFEMSITPSFQQNLKQLSSNKQSSNQHMLTRIEIVVTVLDGSLSNVIMSSESPNNQQPLINIDQPINQAESITLMLDRVNSNQFQPRSWFITLTNTFKQTKVQLTGRVVSTTTTNENGKKTSSSRLQSAKLLGYGSYGSEEQKSNSQQQSESNNAANMHREDQAYHAMVEPPQSKV